MNLVSTVAFSVFAYQLFFSAGISFRAIAQPTNVPPTGWHYTTPDGLPLGFQRYDMGTEEDVAVFVKFPTWFNRRYALTSIDSREPRVDEATPPNPEEKKPKFRMFSRKRRTKVPKNDNKSTEGSAKAPKKPIKCWRACFPKNKKRVTKQDSTLEEVHGIPSGEELPGVPDAQAGPSTDWCYGSPDPPLPSEPESPLPMEFQSLNLEESESQNPEDSDPPMTSESESHESDDSDHSDIVREFEKAE